MICPHCNKVILNSREMILECLKLKPLRMTDLEKTLNISRGSLRHHLNILEKEGKIEPMQRDNTKHGRPTFIKIIAGEHELNSNSNKNLNLTKEDN